MRDLVQRGEADQHWNQSCRSLKRNKLVFEPLVLGAGGAGVAWGQEGWDTTRVREGGREGALLYGSSEAWTRSMSSPIYYSPTSLFFTIHSPAGKKPHPTRHAHQSAPRSQRENIK
ncbi:hypothetical protein Pcinc_041419 [Petrolisthes cinctipes]|uniref:Uncharacterized protein n=1 Tax=Petrolisthes cinctipes TaxID=88211 RepID=A0AAE1BJL5_PETCI|nr:hypothetical protein Pcinc_041419 [Petrolisthes cinctipes]